MVRFGYEPYCELMSGGGLVHQHRIHARVFVSRAPHTLRPMFHLQRSFDPLADPRLSLLIDHFVASWNVRGATRASVVVAQQQ
jgi:hypothetical protein